MSEKKTTTKSGGFSFKGILNFIAFIAICCIGISLLVGKIGVGSIAGAFNTIAQVLAYLITSISAFNYAMKKRHWAYFTVWVVCVVLIVVLLVIK